jgi:Protein of unknown function (DUF3179)/Galactose oxidase, central domain
MNHSIIRIKSRPATFTSGAGTIAPLRAAMAALMIGLGAVHTAFAATAGGQSQQIVTANLIKEKIVAITKPKFLSAKDADFLQADERVVGAFVDKIAKAYPIRILKWHEVVNDITDGKPVVMTFCPLTGDSALYERKVGGKTVIMSPTDKLYESTTTFSDSATHSLWSQFDGKAIAGPEKGKKLPQLASILTTWALWKAFHPNTLVLSTDTGFARDYRSDPFTDYERADTIKFPVSNDDSRVPRNEMVLGVDVDHHAEAFPFTRMLGTKMPIVTRIGDKKITIVFDPATGTAGAADDKEHISAYTGAWFGWAAFHPSSEIWGKAPPKPAAVQELPIIFKEGGDQPQPREGETATLLKNGKVLIAGGDTGRTPMLATAELYDPAKRTFSDTGKMKTPRGGHDATLLADGRVLITGGIDNIKVIPAAEIYDPATGQFAAIEAMHMKRQKHTATLLRDGRVLIAGGFSGQSLPTSSTELFDSSRKVFVPGPPMISARQNHAATVLSDGRILLTGGIGAKGELASAEIYDPSTGRFTATGDMHAARQGHTATLLNNGEVLITGGYAGSVPAMTEAELYDPKAGRFTRIDDLAVAREGHRAVLLKDGEVLILGGSGTDPQHRYLASAELYNPSTRRFTLLGEMLLPRFGPTVTLLDDGDVLVTGRFAAPAYFATSTTELYQPQAKAKQ